MAQAGRKLAVVGVGYSPVSRKSDYTVLELATLACRAAIEDAGMSPKDIDGLAEYGFPFEPASTWDVAETLGIPGFQGYPDRSIAGPAGLRHRGAGKDRE